MLMVSILVSSILLGGEEGSNTNARGSIDFSLCCLSKRRDRSLGKGTQTKVYATSEPAHFGRRHVHCWIKLDAHPQVKAKIAQGHNCTAIRSLFDVGRAVSHEI